MRPLLARLLLSGCLAAVLAAGCSNQNDVRLRYDAERRLQQAERLLRDAQVRNALSNPAEMKELHGRFNEVAVYSMAALDSLSSSADPTIRTQVSELAFQSSTRLAQFLFSERSYDSCISLLHTLNTRVKLPSLESAVIWVNLGQAHQAKGEWNQAVEVYDKALSLTDPPLDERGDVIFDVFNLPAHMYSIYAEIGDSARATASFDRAITYYRLFTNRFPQTKLGVASFANLSALFVDRQMWNEAVSELSRLRDSTGEVNWEARVRMADILAGQLKQYDSALALYDGAATRLIGNDTMARPVIQFKKGLLFLQEKKYDAARQTLNALNQAYPAYFASNPTAQFAKAKSFEEEGNWDRAETEYRFLIENYAGSDEAMSTYLYLGEQFTKLGRTVEASRWMDGADTFYQQIVDKYRGTAVEARALTYQAEILRRNADWNGAITKLLGIFNKYPGMDIGQRGALAAAAIARDKLMDSARAESIIAELKRSLTSVVPPSEN
jgi:tetratricopeptide (TPR) repeat protein